MRCVFEFVMSSHFPSLLKYILGGVGRRNKNTFISVLWAEKGRLPSSHKNDWSGGSAEGKVLLVHWWFSWSRTSGPEGILSPGMVSWVERKECQGMSSPVEGVGEEAGSSTEPFGGCAFCLCSSSGKSALVTLPVQVFLVLIIRQVRGQQTAVLFPLGPGIVHRATTHVEGNQRLKQPPSNVRNPAVYLREVEMSSSTKNNNIAPKTDAACCSNWPFRYVKPSSKDSNPCNKRKPTQIKHW